MTAAIALPTSIAPAASAPQATATSASGEGFAAALAGLLGIATGATPTHGTQTHAHVAKAQSAPGAKAQTGQADSSATATPLVGIASTPVVAASAAPQLVPTDATSAKGAKTQVPLVASGATANAAAATAIAAGTPEAPASVQPQTAAVVAQQAAAAAATNSVAAPQPASATVKTAQKPATAKHTPTPATPTTDLQDQTTNAKPVAPNQIAAAAQRSASDGTSGNGTELTGGKVDAAVPQPAAAASFVATLHNTADAPTAVAPSAVAQAAVPLDALAVHIARKFESGESRFEIRLDPAGLGKLDISMTVDHDGRVQAVLRAERPETLDLLQRDARVLENQLRQTGLNVDSNSLNFSLGQGNGGRQAFAEGHQPFARALDFAPELEATKTASAIVTLRDGVDIRI